MARASLRFDDLALAGRTLVTSAPEGLYTRTLGPDGAPEEAAVRVDAACDGGLDALREGSRLWIACLRRSTPKGEGAALLLEVEGGRLRRRAVLGRAGRDARGIDLIRDGDGWAVAWHDGVPGSWGVWLARRTGSLQPRGPARRLSAPHVSAGRPSMLRRGDALWVVWPETWIEAGYPRGQVLAWTGHGVPRRLVEVDVLEPSPVLHHDDRSAILFFRDLRRPSRRVGLFAQRFDENWRPLGRTVRVGRGDGTTPFRVLSCAGATVTVTPRSWDGDLLIGVNLLDDRLRKRVPEQQVYEWAARFATTAARCEDDTLLLIAAEQSRAPDTEVAAHALTLRCE